MIGDPLLRRLTFFAILSAVFALVSVGFSALSIYLRINKHRLVEAITEELEP